MSDEFRPLGTSEEDARAFFVLGMHRSGTSALTRTLNLCGLTLAEDLLQPKQDNNAPGFWESESTYRLNDTLLKELGSHWADWHPVDLSRSATQVPDLADRAGRLLMEHFAKAGNALIKDPRICRLLPIWLAGAQQAGRSPYAVLALRHPTEVAMSLQARDRMPRPQSYMLWLSHALAAEHDSRNLRRGWIQYHELLEDWRGCLHELGAALECKLHPDQAAEEQIEAFLNPVHRHQITPQRALEQECRPLPDVIAAWELLQQLAKADRVEAATIYPQLDAIHERLKGLSATVRALGANEASEDSVRLQAPTSPAPAQQKPNEATVSRAWSRQQVALPKNRTPHNLTALIPVERPEPAAPIIGPPPGGRTSPHHWDARAIHKTLQRLPPRKALGAAHQSAHRRSNLLRRARRILRSGLFDAAYVERQLAQRHIVAEVSPLWVWLEDGWQQSINPHPLFDVGFYCGQRNGVCGPWLDPLTDYLENQSAWSTVPHPLLELALQPDTQAKTDSSRLTPLQRHLKHPALERPRGHWLFDQDWYLSDNPQVRKSGQDPLIHYLETGWREGRQPHWLFDGHWYLSSNPDVAAAGLCPLVHYVTHGHLEHRNPHPWFDAGWVEETQRGFDKTSYPVLRWYLEKGDASRHSPHPRFDPKWYLQAYPDVAAANIHPLKHYLAIGGSEGRHPCDPGALELPFSLAADFAPARVDLPQALAGSQSQTQSPKANELAKATPAKVRFSIIMPCWQRASIIDEAIRSVEAQAYPHWELLVCDDGSEDQTLARIRGQFDHLIESGRLIILESRHAGVSAARNLGLEHAQGDWVAFLDSDNLWEKDFLHTVALAIQREPHRLAWYVDVRFHDLDAQRCFSYDQDYDWPQLAHQNFIDLNGFIHRRHLCQYLGGFSTELRRLVDWDYIARLAYSNPPQRIPQPLVTHRLRADLKNITTTEPLSRQAYAVSSQLATRRLQGASIGDLRLAYVLWDWPSLSQSFVLAEIRSWLVRGADVVVYFHEAATPHAEVPEGLTCKQIRNAWHLASSLQSDNRNWIHTHFAFPAGTKLAWPAARATGIPFSLMVHAVDIFHHANRQRNRLAEMTADPLCAAILAHGAFHAKCLQSQGVPSQKVVYQPQASSTVSDVSPLTAEATDARPATSPVRLVAIGRLVAKKGFDDLLMALAQLPDCFHLNLHGYGPERTALEQIIQEYGLGHRVHLCGAFSGANALRDIFADSAMLVVPSKVDVHGDSDGFPTVIVEALRHSVPVVATKVTAIPELLRHGVDAWIAPPNAPGALAKLILDIAALPQTMVRAVTSSGRRRMQTLAGPDGPQRALEQLILGPRLELVMVTYHPQLREEALQTTLAVINSVLQNTRLPFRLTIVDNASCHSFRSALMDCVAGNSSVRILLQDKNLQCGPAINLALADIQAQHAVYLCSNEAFIARPGWDSQLQRDVLKAGEFGLAGHIVTSPAWTTGADYAAQEWFAKVRHPEFAWQQPDRRFGHVQGGCMVMHVPTVEAVGGWSNELPQQYTDVELSYVMEAHGYSLKNLPSLASVSAATHPNLESLVDENIVLAHPLTRDTHAALDAIRHGQVRCNLCQTVQPPLTGVDINFSCERCGSDGRDRAIWRWLWRHSLPYQYRMDQGVLCSAALRSAWERGQFVARGTSVLKVPELIPGPPSAMLGIPPHIVEGDG